MLESLDLPLAVVDAIAGQSRYRGDVSRAGRIMRAPRRCTCATMRWWRRRSGYCAVEELAREYAWSGGDGRVRCM